MTTDLSEAPTFTIKDKMVKELKEKSQDFLVKYFEGREYQKENIVLWKDYALEELNHFLKTNYEGFGFAYFFIINKNGDIRTDANGIARQDTDSFMVSNLETKTFYVEIRIRFYKLYNKITILNSFHGDLMAKMNDLLFEKLEGKKYSQEFAKDKTKEILVELQKSVLISIPKSCSCQVCYILSKPIDYKFDCNIINMNYIPLTATFSNDSLFALLALFIFDN